MNKIKMILLILSYDCASVSFTAPMIQMVRGIGVVALLLNVVLTEHR